jgi:hypothetical protein
VAKAVAKPTSLPRPCSERRLRSIQRPWRHTTAVTLHAAQVPLVETIAGALVWVEMRF